MNVIEIKANKPSIGEVLAFMRAGAAPDTHLISVSESAMERVWGVTRARACFVRLPVLLLGDGKMNVLTLMSQAEIGTVSVAMFVIGAIASTPILGKLKKASEKSAVLPILGDVALLAMFIICIAELATGSYNPFIYFAF